MVNLICALGRNGVIGKDGDLAFRIPADIKRFKRLTENNIVIMGRKTFDSLGSLPLPNRLNIVMSSTLKPVNYENLVIVDSVDGIFEVLKDRYENMDVFVIGGNRIYAEFMQYVDTMYLTWIEADLEGDTFFPMELIDFSQWNKTDSIIGSHNGVTYRFDDYKRKDA